jgi:hypothetical protein
MTHAWVEGGSTCDTGELRFKLRRTNRFCRVHTCPICQWRWSLMWPDDLRKPSTAFLRRRLRGVLRLDLFF